MPGHPSWWLPIPTPTWRRRWRWPPGRHSGMKPPPDCCGAAPGVAIGRPWWTPWPPSLPAASRCRPGWIQHRPPLPCDNARIATSVRRPCRRRFACPRDTIQYIYTMIGVSKTVPPKREIIKDISLSFFPGAKIGLLGLNGAGKSTVLRIMAGVDRDFQGEARAQPGIKIGYLEQEPKLDPEKTVREVVEEGLGEILTAQAE